MEKIFLSASIPLPGREYYETGDPVMIHAAVRSFFTLVLGRRHVVWGGHPSITPLVDAACKSFEINYQSSVTLYQSKFFIKNFPEQNKEFVNLRLIDAAEDISKSMLAMRVAMFEENKFAAGIFIGGMQGIFDEHEFFRKHNPGATSVVVASTGGAALALAESLKLEKLDNPYNFTKLFIETLGISPLEIREELHD